MALAVVPCAFAVVHPARFQQTCIFPHRVLLTGGKLLCPNQQVSSRPTNAPQRLNGEKGGKKTSRSNLLWLESSNAKVKGLNPSDLPLDFFLTELKKVHHTF